MLKLGKCLSENVSNGALRQRDWVFASSSSTIASLSHRRRCDKRAAFDHPPFPPTPHIPNFLQNDKEVLTNCRKYTILGAKFTCFIFVSCGCSHRFCIWRSVLYAWERDGGGGGGDWGLWLISDPCGGVAILLLFLFPPPPPSKQAVSLHHHAKDEQISPPCGGDKFAAKQRRFCFVSGKLFFMD